MKQVLLISGLILILLMALFNCSMLWDFDGIGLWISGIFSTFAIPIPLLILLIRSKNKWLRITRIFAIVTFAMPVIISEIHHPVLLALENTLLALNLVLIPLCVLSVITLIFKKENSVNTDLARSSNS